MGFGEADTRAKLIDPAIFQTPDVVKAGGLPALKAFGNPADILREAKTRIFAA